MMISYTGLSPISQMGDPHPSPLNNKGATFFKNRLVVTRYRGKHENLDMTSEVMKAAHDTPLSIHPGSTKMYQDIRPQFWWPNMKQDILVMLKNVTFAVASRQNIKDLLE